jgi:hypothetical protein
MLRQLLGRSKAEHKYHVPSNNGGLAVSGQARSAFCGFRAHRCSLRERALFCPRSMPLATAPAACARPVPAGTVRDSCGWRSQARFFEVRLSKRGPTVGVHQATGLKGNALPVKAVIAYQSHPFI